MAGKRIYGIEPTLDGAARPRAGLGIKTDRPKMPKLDTSVHYTNAQVAGPGAKGSVQKHGLTHMPHKLHPV
jgi:hypothetical protein